MALRRSGQAATNAMMKPSEVSPPPSPIAHVPAAARTVVAYLGPEGTFTHAAALRWGDLGRPVPFGSVLDVYQAVDAGTAEFGVVAIESSVEGYVVPSLDEIVGARNVVAIDEDALDITFDAFILPGTDGQQIDVTAHPHGLAQCQGFVHRTGLSAVPAASNAAGCRDLTAQQVALGPSLCGELYGLTTVERGVQDFAGARTRFLLITNREQAQSLMAERAERAGDTTAANVANPGWRTMLAVTPHEIGPGVLARITATFGALGANMTSLITRPLKAQEGTYAFIVTTDGAPWEEHLRELFNRLLAAGDSLKTLGVFPARQMTDGAFDCSRVPAGSVRADQSDQNLNRGLLW